MGLFRRYKNITLDIVYTISLLFSFYYWFLQWEITPNEYYLFEKRNVEIFLMWIGFSVGIHFSLKNVIPMFKKIIVKLGDA